MSLRRLPRSKRFGGIVVSLSFALTLSADRVRELARKSESVELQIAELEQVLAEDDRWLAQLEELYDKACTTADEGGDADEVVMSLWGAACERIAAYQTLGTDARQEARGRFRKQLLAAVAFRMDRLAELMRTMAIVWQELELETPDEIHETVWTIRIHPLAYLRAMWNLFWSSVRHPLSETVIELKTGRVLRTQ